MRLMIGFFGIMMAVLISIGGCIELSEDLGRDCSSQEYCQEDMSEVCGADGKIYACAPLAQCHEVAVNPDRDACDSGPEECPALECGLDCEVFARDADGCEICACDDEPDDICAQDPCTARYCAAEAKDCVPQSQSSDDEHCVEVGDLAPEAVCDCAGGDCALKGCASDDDCRGADGSGLCVRNADDPSKSYCVAETCDTLVERYPGSSELPEHLLTCETDEDCTTAGVSLSCCGGFYINQEGAEVYSSLNQVVSRTSCAEEAQAECRDSGIACGAMAPPACVEGICSASL